MGSSEDFVKSLKAPEDPPKSSVKTKIQIARDAWDDTSFVIPSKEKLIVEWILTRFLKEHAKNKCICDTQHWALLTDILTTFEKSPAWLTPILTSIPFAPVLINLLKEFSSLDAKAREEITGYVSCTLRYIWPVAVTRMSADTLFDCFGTLLANLAVNQDLSMITNHVVTSYRSSFTNSSNKKRLYATFTQLHLGAWVKCVQNGTEAVYEAGAETLFSLEALRRSADPSPELFDSVNDSGHILPRLFTHYAQSLRKHRTALFGHGSSSGFDSLNQDVASKSMAFYTQCQKVLKGKPQAWPARVTLLNVVATENLFMRLQPGNAEAALKSELQDVILCMANGNPPPEAIRVLVSLMNIDERLFDDSLPRVLSHIINLPRSAALNGVIVEFLDRVLDYYVKIRSLHLFVDALFTALTSLTVELTSELYSRACSGVMFVGAFRDKLSSALRRFLTPTQTTELVQKTLARLESSKIAINSPNSEERPRKKRRTAEPDGGAALVFTLSLKIATIVISSVSHRHTQSLHGDVQQFIDSCDISTLTKSLKESEWVLQVTAAALLRFCRELKWAMEGLEVTIRGKALRRLEELLMEDTVAPELQVETACTLLAHSMQNSDAVHPERAIDLALAYVERHLEPSVSWSGYPSQLDTDTSGTAGAALALLEALVLDRFLPLLDVSGTPTHLLRLATILTSVDLQRPIGAESWTPTLVVYKLLHNAFFWEQASVRVAMLNHLESLVGGAMENLQIYDFMVHVPAEYLNRSTKTKLIQWAMEADLSNISISAHTRTHLRTFLARAIASQMLVETDVEIVAKSLASLLQVAPGESQGLRAATRELTGVYTSIVLRASLGKSHSALHQFLSLFSVPESMSNSTLREGFGILVKLLNRDATFGGFDEETQQALRNLHTKISDVFRNQMAESDMSGDLPDLVSISGWVDTESFGRWLSIAEHTIHGPRLITSLLKHGINKQEKEYLSRIMDLLFVEALGSVDRFSFAIATYILLSRSNADSIQPGLALHIRNACNSLQAEEYIQVLSIVDQALLDMHTADEDLPGLLHIGITLVRESPPGTLKYIQKFVYQCLTIFANNPKYTQENAQNSLLVIRLISHYVTDRAPALRSMDITYIWTVLAQLISPSKEHDTHTSREVFHEVVSVLTSLVRLRRDLVVSTLPHLGIILQRLTATMRNQRPGLGGKQSRMVLDGLPRWISGAEPLGVPEAKVLSRLFESLIVKTVPRTYHGTQEQQAKAESLAKPFSKHAAYVINSYIDAVNDPLCVVPIEMRRELEPGLFALCEMTSDHSRDALVASALDANGKAVMKDLWKAYSVQKYSGKG